MVIVERVGGIDNHHQNHFFLPKELVIEILLRLRVKSLLRFKTVCKYWYDVINGYNFLDDHYDHHSNHSRLLVYHVIADPIHFDFGEEPYAALSIFPDETLTGEHPSHHYLDYPSMPFEVQWVIGPVKGIFWLPRYPDESHKGYNGALLNPATREYRPLLVPYSNLHSDLWMSFQIYGFGFDPLTKDLKVVSLWCWNESEASIPPNGRPSVAVYSLVNDSWKYLDLEHDPLNKKNRNKLYLACSTTYMNGPCYWVVVDGKKYFLLSFDLTSDVLREIKGPEYNKMGNRAKIKLVVYNDSIAIFFYLWDRGRGGLLEEYIDLMVMKKEGVWTKDLTVDISHLKMDWLPLGFWKNNSIFLHAGDDMQLVLYDYTTHEIKELGIHKLDREDRDSSPFIYKESLVSLKGGNVRHEMRTLQDIFTYRVHSLEGEENEDPND